jgi:hypothetical protein
MSNADDDSGSGSHEDELHDLITLLDDLMEDLEARVQMDFDDPSVPDNCSSPCGPRSIGNVHGPAVCPICPEVYR